MVFSPKFYKKWTLEAFDFLFSSFMSYYYRNNTRNKKKGEAEEQQCVPQKNATVVVLDEFYSHILGLLVPHNGSHNSHVKWENDLPHRQL